MWSPAAGRAEVGAAAAPTLQATAADAAWLAYAPPPARPGVVCLVDSGVDINPDTEGIIVGAKALAPETSSDDELGQISPRIEPGEHPDGHGTLMAMLMAAPRNNWGMVGIAPTSVRVYNMKALPAGAKTFPFSYYAVAIESCRRLKNSAQLGVFVTNLSLGGVTEPSEVELDRLGNFVASSHESGISIVAAAGNNGGSVLYPAAYPGVLAVGAGDAGAQAGTLCAFSARGPSLALLAPGCDGAVGGISEAFIDNGEAAYGSGSSQASALVAAVLASMRAYLPSLTAAGAESCLLMTAVGGSLDVKAAFDGCDLGAVVASGEAARAAAVGTEMGPGAAASSPAIESGGAASRGSAASKTVRTHSFERPGTGRRAGARGTCRRLRSKRGRGGRIRLARGTRRGHCRRAWKGA